MPFPDPNLVRRARALYAPFVLVLAIVFGNVFGLEIALLVVAGGVLGGAIWFVWTSLQGLAGAAPLTLDEALSLGAPSVEEEQKRAVLRALKDLEYEREVGKLSDADYESLALHYRSEAKRLLRVVDADLSAERERAARLVEERLAAETATTGAVANADGDGDASDAANEDADAGDVPSDEEATADDDDARSSLPTSDPVR